MNYSEELAIVVVSCDKYCDLWDDMFNLMDLYWPNRQFKTYLATDTKEYKREGVEVIHFGNIRQWMVCTRKAIEQIVFPYVLFLMDDYFIVKHVNEDVIAEDLQFMKQHNGSFMDLQRKPDYLNEEDSLMINPNIISIPKHTRYGITTDGAIWNRDFFLRQLGKEDGDAWRFEIMLVEEAKTEIGLEGNIFYDNRCPIHICEKEVVRLGKFTLDAVKIVEGTGYKILSTRARMSKKEFFIDQFKCKMARIKHGRKVIKRIASLFGFTFFTND